MAQQQTVATTPAPAKPADAPLVAWATKLPRDLPPALKQAALDHDRTVQDITQEALRTWLKEHSK